MTAYNWDTLEPGIYFNLPFETYLKQDCLNASGIKQLAISATDFWASSWMNPNKNDIDDETKAKMEGRAYHKRILEGKNAFYNEYAPDFEHDGQEKLIDTSEEIAGALAIRGLKTSFKRKEEGIQRLLEADPTAMVRDTLIKNHRAKHSGKDFLPASLIRYIEYSAKMIEYHPDLRTYCVGGYPEVTIIWDDEELGVRFKIRIDYQKVGSCVDLKTFANQMRHNIALAIKKAIENQKYYIQARLYLRGREAARSFVKQGKVFGADNVDKKWLSAFADTPNDEFWYIFQQKGIAPVARGAKFTLLDKDFDETSMAIIKNACALFKTSYDTFGTMPWVDLSPTEYLSFKDFWV